MKDAGREKHAKKESPGRVFQNKKDTRPGKGVESRW